MKNLEPVPPTDEKMDKEIDWILRALIKKVLADRRGASASESRQVLLAKAMACVRSTLRRKLGQKPR